MPRLFFALIFIFAASFTHAAEVTDLYQAQLPVASQSEQERLHLAPELLKQVIIKVVGDRQAVQQADISALTTDAKRYIEQYSYQQVTTIDNDTTDQQLALTIDFDEQGVNNALQRIGLPIWDKRRPETLFWIAADYEGEQRMSAEGDEDLILATVEQVAKQRGIPLLLPLMDLQDQTQLTFNDVTTGNNSAIQTASERYGASIIVTAHLSGNADAAEMRWQAMVGDNTEQWPSQGALQTAIENGVNELADRLGRQFNMPYDTSGALSELSIQVTGIHDYEGYNRLIAYLESLQAVSEVQVGSLRGETLDLVLSIQGQPERVQQLLSVGRVVQAEHHDGSQQYYRLLP